jgi:hypothetical protein
MHIFLKKEQNPRLWSLTRDPKILKNNEKNGRTKPSEPAEFITRDMILG